MLPSKVFGSFMFSEGCPKVSQSSSQAVTIGESSSQLDYLPNIVKWNFPIKPQTSTLAQACLVKSSNNAITTGK